jgi:hypothetical protein
MLAGVGNDTLGCSKLHLTASSSRILKGKSVISGVDMILAIIDDRLQGKTWCLLGNCYEILRRVLARGTSVRLPLHFAYADSPLESFKGN